MNNNMFEYIAPINFSIPYEVIERLDSYMYIGPTIRPQIARQVEKLIHQSNQEELSFPITLVSTKESVKITQEVFRELKEINLKILKESGLTTPAVYNKIEIIGELKQLIIQHIPKILHKFNPTPVIQTIEGQGMVPHTDFMRTCSLFFLLSNPENWSTEWYESKKDIDVQTKKYGFIWPFVNFEDIELKKTYQIEKNKWYVFDNHTYHAVKYNGDHAVRRAFQIEFSSITAEGLFNLLNEKD